MRQHQEELEVRTRGRGLVDISAEVAAVVRRAGVGTGLCVAFVRHTSASLVIQENADPAVLRDLERFMAQLAPERAGYEHDAEGPDDMPAHLRATVTRSSENIPVVRGELGLGTWQALYLYEHRARPHTRAVVVHVVGS